MVSEHIDVLAKTVDNVAYPAHFHKAVEFMLVCSGCLKLRVNQECYTLNQGDLFYCAGGDIHGFTVEKLGNRVLYVLFNPDFLQDEAARSLLSSTPSTPVSSRNASSSVLKKFEGLLTDILTEMNEQGPGYECFVKSRLWELCGLLRREVIPLREAALGHFAEPNTLAIRQALDYIGSHYMAGITLADTARHVNYSISRFSAVFKSACGISFKDLVNEMRVEKARQLILNTGKPFYDIAQECGFESYRSFFRAFTRLKGVSPSCCRHLNPEPMTRPDNKKEKE